MSARIYRPAKTAMQSGRAKTQRWLLEFDAAERSMVEPLMGWVSSGNTLAQVKLWFETKEEAQAYATRNGIACRIEEPSPEPERRAMAYSDNFKSSRIGTWTH